MIDLMWCSVKRGKPFSTTGSTLGNILWQFMGSGENITKARRRNNPETLEFPTASMFSKEMTQR